MIGMELGERRVGRRRAGHAARAQHEVEVGPAALLIVRHLNGGAGVELLFLAWLRCGEVGGGHADTVAPERVADACPVRVDEDATRVEKHGLNRHHFSLHW